MNVIKEIESWYLENCDGEWEHGGGFRIENIDNPGWLVNCDIEATYLEDKEFTKFFFQRKVDDDWILCKVENNIFKGRGGPKNFEEILTVFLDWANGREPWKKYECK